MHDLFLCHTGADKDWTRSFGERLEQEQIDGRQVKVWFDEWDIAHGQSIITKIDEGLRTSRYVGVILSPAALAADWPTAEWQSQVMDDPAGRSAKVLPIILRKTDPASGAPLQLPFILKMRRWFDFSESHRFGREFQALLNHLKGHKPPRGRSRLGAAIESRRTSQDAPDRVQESLPSNLFPVLRLPDFVYSDQTTAQKYPDVWAHFKNDHCPPFALSGDRLFSFVPPTFSPHPFGSVLTRLAPLAEPTRAFLGDKDRSRLLLGMLNRAFRDHCYRKGIHTPKQDREQYFCPVFDGKPRMFSWGSGKERTLAKLAARPNLTPFGVHHSAKMRFLALGDSLFLLVQPGWLFTQDGVTPLTGPEVGVFSTKWGGRERNAAVLRNVLMWGLLVSQGGPQALIALGGGSDMLLKATPAHTQVSAGIENDILRLDRLLGGDGAGETTGGPADELDLVADLALAGAMDASAEEEDATPEITEEAPTDDDPDAFEWPA